MPNVRNDKKYIVIAHDGTELLPGATKNLDTTLAHNVALIANGELTVLDAVAAPAARTVGVAFSSDGVPDNAIGNNGEYWVQPTSGALFKRIAGVWTSISGGAALSSPPPYVTGLAFRLCADDTTGDDGARVSAWKETTDPDAYVVQPVLAKCPIIVRGALNGHDIVRFDGVDDNLVGGHVDIAQPVTIFAWLKQFAGGAAQQAWVDGTRAGARTLLYRFDGADMVSMYAGSADVTYHRAAVWPSAYVCFNAIYNGAATKMWENKVPVIAAGNPGGLAFSGPTIGDTYNFAFPAHIDLAELLVYSGSLSDVNREAVVDWGNAKYGL